MKKHSPKNSPGFTLVELLVVIAIIGILIAMLLPAVQVVAMCDGSCKFIVNEIDLANFQAMCIRDDGQVIDWK